MASRTIGSFGEIGGFGKACGQFRRADGKHFLRQQELDLGPRPVSGADADAEIDVGTVGIGEFDRRFETYPDFGMQFPETGKPRHQPFRREDRRHGDSQRALGLFGSQLHRHVQFTEAGRKAGKQRAAELRRLEPVRRAFEDEGAKLPLGLDDLLADGARRHAEFGGGPLQASPDAPPLLARASR